MKYRYDIEKLIPFIRQYAADSSFVLELGPCDGDGSTLAIQEGLEANGRKDNLFVSVDIVDIMLIKPKLPYWHLILGDSTDKKTLNKVKKISKTKKADFIFIDTIHTYEHMKQELLIWAKLADDDTVWAFHDIWMMGEYNHMTDAIKEFADQNGWIYEDITTDSHGLGLMRKGKKQ